MFAAQLERHIASDAFYTKVVISPSPVNEKGLVVKVSALKSFLQGEPKGVRASRMIRVRVSVCGTAESMTGLEQALDAIEALDGYLTRPGLRLEVPNTDPQSEPAYLPLANSRIIQAISQEDSFIDNPDSPKIQDVQDDRIITITIPAEEP
jgi:hypothetical protein